MIDSVFFSSYFPRNFIYKIKFTLNLGIYAAVFRGEHVQQNHHSSRLLNSDVHRFTSEENDGR